ncbi:MAG: hypothetical protein [Podoviridae sp. ctpVR23]|nr:MAG: hypothetical protein [Podoviridae sp. ctpVR23]
MLKHESGYFIADPEGLAAFHALYGDANRECELPVRMMALVKKEKRVTIKDHLSSSGIRYAVPPEGGTYIWEVVEIERDITSPIYFDRTPKKIDEYARITQVGQKHYSNCWFPREVIPFEFIKSPARLALEALGAKLQ